MFGKIMAKTLPKMEKTQPKPAKSLILLARLAGLEPAACGLEVRCSIQLSYRRMKDLL